LAVRFVPLVNGICIIGEKLEEILVLQVFHRATTNRY
jgi:hypothetical protein